MTFTARELESKIEETDFGYTNAWSALWNEDWEDGTENLGEPFGALEVVKTWGGEGKGDSAGIILRVDGRLFRKQGYYASYDGADFDGDFAEVEAYEKTVTDYRPVTA